MELVHIVLLLVIVVLTILLAVLGIQVFLILREIRKTVEKTNKVLDNAGIIAESLSIPISTLSSLVISIKTGISFASWLKKTYDFLLHHTSHKDTKNSSRELSQEAPSVRPRSNWDIGEQANGETHPNPTPSEKGKPIIRRFFKGIGRKIKI